MTPAEGSDLEIGFVRPLGQGRGVWWSPIHRSSGFALDLCLFSTDLCRGPFSVDARTSCVLLWGSIGDKKGVDFLGEASGGNVEDGGKFLDVEKCGVCGCYQAISLVCIDAVYLSDAEECGIDNSFICS